ncbi:MAG: hypothetical protein HYW14_02640 [Planctomycetes bacterium]|nr:hypothetical protein [Planctomycetota bacterium]MBI4006972.1 hypothetical protein [Planctomycetota bacterium]
MALETKTYITSDFKEFDTKSKEKEYEIVVKNLYPPDTSEIEFVWVSTNDIYDKIAGLLYKAKVVDRIFLVREENTFCIWTSLQRYDKNARYALYNQEIEIIKYFSSVEFHFDFHLAEPEDIEELLASGARLIYPKNQR